MSFARIAGAGIATAVCALSLSTPSMALAAQVTDAVPEQPAPRTTVDTGFDFEFSGSGSTQGTSWRSKETTSSVYVNATWVEGAKPKIFTDGAVDWKGNNSHNRTIGGFVRIPRIGRYEIHNTIRENYNSHARLP